MKKFAILFVLAFVFPVQARYNGPINSSQSRADSNAQYMFKYLDKNGDGKLSIEEYRGQRMTRDVRRKVRAAQKEGTYKSPDQEFDEIGPDEEGFISREDFINYTRVKRGDKKAKFERRENEAGDEDKELESETEENVVE